VRALTRYINQVQAAVADNDFVFAESIYRLAEGLVGTTTDAALENDGFMEAGTVEPVTGCELTRYVKALETPIIGPGGHPRYFKNVVVKTISWSEAKRIHVLETANIPHLITFELRPKYVVGGREEDQNPARFSMIMDQLEGSMEVYSNRCCLPLPASLLLWRSMKSALEALHAMELAHMDVKPANICRAPGGNPFTLIDVGSTTPFGEQAASTRAFVPSDLQASGKARLTSEARIDWWMLAMTLMDVASLKPGNVGLGAVDADRDKIKEFLAREENFPKDIWDELKDKLK
jgi:serine/threonine protein kinase